MKTIEDVVKRLNRLEPLKNALTERFFVDIMNEKVSPIGELVFRESKDLHRVYGLVKAEQKVEQLLSQNIMVLHNEYPQLFSKYIEPPYSELLLDVLAENNFDVLDRGDFYLVRYRIPYGNGNYVMKFEMAKEDEKMKDDFLRVMYFHHIRRIPVSVPESVYQQFTNEMKRVSKETMSRFNVVRHRVTL